MQRNSAAHHNVPEWRCLKGDKSVFLTVKAEICEIKCIHFYCWTLPSMPMSSRLDVNCPQFLWACCLLIQFQLNPRKSRTILFPTVSFKVCCRYTLEMGKKNASYIWGGVVYRTDHSCTITTEQSICSFPRKLHIYMTQMYMDTVNPNIYSVSLTLDVSSFRNKIETVSYLSLPPNSSILCILSTNWENFISVRRDFGTKFSKLDIFFSS